MPYVKGTNHHFNYASRLTQADISELNNNETYPKFHNHVEALWLKHVYQNAGEMIQSISESEQFADQLVDLIPGPDYATACDENNVHVCDGTNDTFFFSWKDLTTVDVESGTSAMIRFDKFAADNGIDITKWRIDPESDEIVAADNPAVAGIQEPDVLTNYINSNILVNGEDIKGFLADLAVVAGKPELAEKLQKTAPEKLFGNYVNNDFISSQSNDDVADAQENACREYRIDADDYAREVLEHWAVDGDMATALENQGETVAEVMGFHIWGRTTSGQAVAMDHCMQQVAIHEFSYSFDNFLEETRPDIAQRIMAEEVAELERQKSPELAAPSI